MTFQIVSLVLCGIANATSTNYRAEWCRVERSHKVTGKFLVKLKTVKCHQLIHCQLHISHMQLIHGQPHQPVSHVVIYSQLFGFTGEMESFKCPSEHL